MEMNLEHPAASTPVSLGELPGLANVHIIWTRSLFYPLLKMLSKYWSCLFFWCLAGLTFRHWLLFWKEHKS